MSDAVDKVEDAATGAWDYLFGGVDVKEVLKRTIKYLFEGLAVVVASMVLSKRNQPTQDDLVLGLTAAAIFAVLDLWAPSISASAKQGAGFGVGAKMVGFP